MSLSHLSSPVGLQSLDTLPEPYQTAFRAGQAHDLPGPFLPVKIEWFAQICMLPFTIMYALPMLGVVTVLISEAIDKPAENDRLWAALSQQTFPELGFTLLLLLLVVVLIGYCTYIAWDWAQSFYRTWHCSQLRKQGQEGYGIVLLSHGLVARLIDNLGRHNCFWLPRQAITGIAWQRIREEGAKHSYWVNRTRIFFVSSKGEKRSIIIKGETLDLGQPHYGPTDDRADRALYETLRDWWDQPAY